MFSRVGYTRRNREKPRSRDLRLQTRDTRMQIGKRAHSGASSNGDAIRDHPSAHSHVSCRNLVLGLSRISALRTANLGFEEPWTARKKEKSERGGGGGGGGGDDGTKFAARFACCDAVYGVVGGICAIASSFGH